MIIRKISLIQWNCALLVISWLIWQEFYVKKVALSRLYWSLIAPETNTYFYSLSHYFKMLKYIYLIYNNDLKKYFNLHVILIQNIIFKTFTTSQIYILNLALYHSQVIILYKPIALGPALKSFLSDIRRHSFWRLLLTAWLHHPIFRFTTFPSILQARI